MNKLKFLRVVYFLPLLLIGLLPVSIPCEQCGEEAHSETFFARAASNFEDNFLCSFNCALDYLEDNPLEVNDKGDILRKTGVQIKVSN